MAMTPIPVHRTTRITSKPHDARHNDVISYDFGDDTDTGPPHDEDYK